MLKKLLVPVDGSESSLKALVYAREIAEQFKGELLIITVAQTHFITAMAEMPIDEVYKAQEAWIIENAKAILKSMKVKMKDCKCVADYRVEKGHPAEKILEVAEAEKVDAIVIGCRGLSGIAEFFMGSVSSKVSEYAHVPVLIVK